MDRLLQKLLLVAFSVAGIISCSISVTRPPLPDLDDTLSATGGDGAVVEGDDAAAAASTVISLEAELGEVTAPMVIQSDPNASQGQYLLTPVGQNGQVALTVDIVVPGDYLIWARILAPSQDQDSFFVSLDHGPTEVFFASNGPNADWQWARVNGDATDQRVFRLEKGKHTLAFTGREANTQLDRILLTNNLDLLPGDAVGGNAAATAVLNARNTPDAINVDGRLSDPAWSIARSVSFSDPARSENHVTVRAVWDDRHLVFAYDVKDEVLDASPERPWPDDGAELFIDVGHEKSPDTDANDYHLIVNINNETRKTGLNIKTLWQAGRYTMEIAIPWSILQTTPISDRIMGLLLGNNDRDGGTGDQFDWMNIKGTGSYFRPNLWGDLALRDPLW